MIIRYPFHFLDDGEFENLVNDLCQDFLGIGTVRFSAGPDGGRDGKFEGTAEKFPSAQSPWDGKFIIQAKHTTNVTASCSDSDFNAILRKEYPRIKKLKNNNEIDNYLLFTNRKVTGNSHNEVVSGIQKETEVSNSQLLGRETLDSWLDGRKDLVRKFRLNVLTEPLRFYERDLSELVSNFAAIDFKNTPIEEQKTFDFLNKDEKNRKNRLGEEYFSFMKETSVSYFSQIDDFLKDPKNLSFKKSYQNTTNELRAKIIVNRNSFGAFEEVMTHLYDYCLENCTSLKSNRMLLHVFLHYMYFNCDIGEKV